MQMAEHLQGDAAHRALLDLGERQFAQFGKKCRRHPQHAVPQQQQQWHRHQRLLDGQEIDDLLHDERDADICELRAHQKREGEQYPAPELPQVGKQGGKRVPLALLAR